MGKNTASSLAVKECSQRVSAIKNDLSAADVIFVGGQAMTASDVAQLYQRALDTRASAVAALGAYKAALAARDAAEAERRVADEALKPYVLNRFGAAGSEGNDFGYAARKVGSMTVATKAKAVLLGKATRAARGTKGKKQKQGIKGALSPAEAAALEALVANGAATNGAARA